MDAYDRNRWISFLIRAAIGLILGWFVVSLVTDDVVARFVGAMIGFFLFTNTRLRVFTEAAIRTPDGGPVPRHTPKPVRGLDSTLVITRIMLGKARDGTADPIIDPARALVRQKGSDAALAGEADAAREAVARRGKCSGSSYAQEKWSTVIAAALDGITDGENHLARQ